MIYAKPGKYRINPQTSKGYFDPIDIDVLSNQTTSAEFVPKPLGEIVVNYAPSDAYRKK